jgi:hypothetical protein
VDGGTVMDINKLLGTVITVTSAITGVITLIERVSALLWPKPVLRSVARVVEQQWSISGMLGIDVLFLCAGGLVIGLAMLAINNKR